MLRFLSGEIDFIQPIPLQDVAQVEGRDGFKVLEGEETRVIMFGFGHEHDTLLYSSDVTDANPFTDPRVRLAAAHAIDIASIDRVSVPWQDRTRQPVGAGRYLGLFGGQHRPSGV